MKKLLLIAAIGIGSLAAVPAKAQVSLSVNIGLQPDWGPRGYDHVDYYYLPDVDSYYDVPTRQYVYLEGGSWVHRRYLPSRYRGYDLYGGRKIVINSRNPWMRHNEYRTRYVTNYRGGGYRGGYGGRTTIIHRNNNFGPRGGFNNHGGPRGGFDHGGPRGGFNHGGPGRGDNHGGGNNHGGPGGGNNHGGGNDHGGGNNHGGGGRGGHRG